MYSKNTRYLQYGIFAVKGREVAEARSYVA